MKTWKSYLIFTPWYYQILMFAVVPLGLLAFFEIFLSHAGGLYPVILLLLSLLDLMADTWVFGGICSGKCVSFEYFKSASHGFNTLRRGLTGDLIRRFFTAALLGTVCFCQTVSFRTDGADTGAADVFVFLAMVLWSYGLSVAGVIIARYLPFRTWGWVVVTAVSGLLLLAGFLTAKSPALLFGIGCLFAVIISVLSVKMVFRKVEKSYYDERS